MKERLTAFSERGDWACLSLQARCNALAIGEDSHGAPEFRAGSRVARIPRLILTSGEIITPASMVSSADASHGGPLSKMAYFVSWCSCGMNLEFPGLRFSQMKGKPVLRQAAHEEDDQREQSHGEQDIRHAEDHQGMRRSPGFCSLSVRLLPRKSGNGFWQDAFLQPDDECGGKHQYCGKHCACADGFKTAGILGEARINAGGEMVNRILPRGMLYDRQRAMPGTSMLWAASGGKNGLPERRAKACAAGGRPADAGKTS